MMLVMLHQDKQIIKAPTHTAGSTMRWAFRKGYKKFTVYDAKAVVVVSQKKLRRM